MKIIKSKDNKTSVIDLDIYFVTLIPYIAPVIKFLYSGNFLEALLYFTVGLLAFFMIFKSLKDIRKEKTDF